MQEVLLHSKETSSKQVIPLNASEERMRPDIVCSTNSATETLRRMVPQQLNKMINKNSIKLTKWINGLLDVSNAYSRLCDCCDTDSDGLKMFFKLELRRLIWEYRLWRNNL